MAIKGEEITVDTTATAIEPSTDLTTQDGFSYEFKVPSGETFYIGGSDVSSDGSNGAERAAGDAVNGDSKEGILYAVVGANSVTVDVTFGRVRSS